MSTSPKDLFKTPPQPNKSLMGNICFNVFHMNDSKMAKIIITTKEEKNTADHGEQG